MKKYLISLIFSVTLAIAIPQHLIADNTTVEASKTTTIIGKENKQAHILVSRLNEIQALDKSSLTFSEKKELRKEVRSIKSQLREIGGGVYLSVGAIIIIILLLIILL